MSDDRMQPYFDEIADRLWSNSAVVMVGAGFSRNAQPTGPTAGSLPSWEQLGDVFYRKLYGRLPRRDAKYLSLLRLAEQVQAAFGRPALNDLLRREVPHLRYEPSRLHVDLLNLPWRDVFTTNYDTLLERACESVPLRHYYLVDTEEDLLYVSGPRIVKLHGSFPSGPFVITEEDYRRYPDDHAPFVNTVRQALLENTLCLVGFSGNDPNFLQWIGWIRDNIGRENATRIYLVGVFDGMGEADRKLLDGRGITAVDLSGISKEPGEALSVFLDRIKGGRTRPLAWPELSNKAPKRAWESSREYRGIVDEWRRQRKAYPGWVVVPEDRRQVLWQYTENWVWDVSELSADDRAEFEVPLDLDLAFELGWRMERCLLPLLGKLPEFLEEVVARYGAGGVSVDEDPCWTATTVSDAITSIRLWLLRHYRETGLQAEWERVRETFGRDLEKLLPETRARIRIEEVLAALFRFDPSEAKRLLLEWQGDEQLPFWEARRAALMAELGEAVAARRILESSLLGIRKQFGLNPVSEDLTLVSQESIAMLMLWAVERGVAVTDPGRPENKDLFGDLSERWNELTRFKCDPRREMASFTARLRHPPGDGQRESRTHRFDLGIVLSTVRFGSDPETLAAYGLLRLSEDLGLPYRMENASFVDDPVAGAISRAGPHSPHWALVSIGRLGKADAADRVFDRAYLARLRRDQVEEYFETYLEALERTVRMVDEPDWSEAKTVQALAKTLPEVFSRLCYKCSAESRARLVGVLEAIYGSRRRHVFGDVRSFLDRVLDSMSVEEAIEVVPSLIDFRMPENRGEQDKRRFVNPIELVRIPVSVPAEAVGVSEERIGQLLDDLEAGGERSEWAAGSLVWLHDRKKLSEKQSERLGSLLWDGAEATGVPREPVIPSRRWMTLPHLPEIVPEIRVKEHVRKLLEERLGDSRRDKTLDELGESASVLQWSERDVLGFLELLKGWWDRENYRLEYDFPMPLGSPAAMLKRSVAKAVDALCALVESLAESESSVARVQMLEGFIVGLRDHGIPVTRLEVAEAGLMAERRSDVIDRTLSGLLDQDRNRVVDALVAARGLARARGEEARDQFEGVARRLVEGVQWRHRPALADRLRVAAQLVKEESWFLSEDVEKALLDGLGQIAEETRTGVKGNDVNGVIDTRAAGATLASVMFRRYEEEGSELPEAIRRWRDLCGSADEFAEVRNAWDYHAGNWGRGTGIGR